MRERHVDRVEEEEGRWEWSVASPIAADDWQFLNGELSTNSPRSQGLLLLTDDYRGSGEVQYIQVEKERWG